MKRWMGLRGLGVNAAAMLLLTACVTINVYFPAAEAKEAAKEFVEKVIGDNPDNVEVKPEPKSDGGGGMAMQGPSTRESFQRMLARVDLLSIVGIGSAHAQGQPDITIKTPAIQAIQARMASRFDSQLRAGFDAGALGFGGDGTIVVRDAAKLAL